MTSNQVNRNQRRFTVQKCTYLQGLIAVQMAAQYENWDSLRSDMEEALPFNSAESRKRRFRSLMRWALDGGSMNPIGSRVWCSYKDEGLSNQVLRERYLDVYPVIGKFVSSVLATFPIGAELGVDAIRDYLIQEHVGALDTSIVELRLTLRDIGFVRKVGRKYVVTETSLPRTAFLVLLHYHLAPEPATIIVPEIIAHPFWRYLGGRDGEEVRSALSQAAACDAISRYVTVDSLEQITTRFALEELLQKRIRLDP